MSSRSNSMSSYFSHFAPDSSVPGTSEVRQGGANFSSQRTMDSQPLAGARDSQSGTGSQSQSRFDTILNGNRFAELKRGMDDMAAMQRDTNSSVQNLTLLHMIVVANIDTLETKVNILLEMVESLQCNTSDITSDSNDEEERNESQDVQEYLKQKCRN